jgi:hypothetical protein
VERVSCRARWGTEAEAKEAKRLFKLRKATKELVETERLYIEDLAHIHLLQRQLKDHVIAEQESSRSMMQSPI